MATIDNTKSLLNLANVFAGNMQIAQGSAMQASSIIQGGEIAAVGAEMTAAGFRESAKSVRGAHNFNQKISAQNNLRHLRSITDRFSQVNSRQIAEIAGTGFASTSRSFLQIRNETANMFERGLELAKIDAINKSRKAEFETQVREVQLENQARAADYQAAASRVAASNKAAQVNFASQQRQMGNLTSAFEQMPSILGGG